MAKSAPVFSPSPACAKPLTLRLLPNVTRIFKAWGLLDALRSTAVEPDTIWFRRWEDGRKIGKTALVPDFGVAPGTSPDGTGNCKGLNNINIPCTCPPSRDEFIASLNANVAAGHAVNNPAVLTPFPTGSSKGDQQARIATLLSTLQNLHGPGVGCPAVSTVYGQLRQQINALPN